MTVNQLLPAVGEFYRHRETGDVGTLTTWINQGRWGNTAVVKFPKGQKEWIGTCADFWMDWIHAAARRLPKRTAP